MGHEFLLVHVHHLSGKKAMMVAERVMLMGSPYGISQPQSTGAHDHLPSNMRTAHDRVNVSHDGTMRSVAIFGHEEILTLSFLIQSTERCTLRYSFSNAT